MGLRAAWGTGERYLGVHCSTALLLGLQGSSRRPEWPHLVSRLYVCVHGDFDREDPHFFEENKHFFLRLARERGQEGSFLTLSFSTVLACLLLCPRCCCLADGSFPSLLLVSPQESSSHRSCWTRHCATTLRLPCRSGGRTTSSTRHKKCELCNPGSSSMPWSGSWRTCFGSVNRQVCGVFLGETSERHIF